jgi:hypothetical protein
MDVVTDHKVRYYVMWMRIPERNVSSEAVGVRKFHLSYITLHVSVTNTVNKSTLFVESEGSLPCSGFVTVFARLDFHGSVHRNINLIERTNKMRRCSRIYYSSVF